MRRPDMPGRTYAALYVLVLVAILYLARPVLVPFALAVLLTFIVTPVAARVERWVHSRAAAVGIVTVVLIGVFAGGAIVVGQQFVGFADQLPVYRATIVRKIRAIQSGPGNVLGRTAAAVRGIGADIAGQPPGEGGTQQPGQPAAQAPTRSLSNSVAETEPKVVAAPSDPEGATAVVWAMLRPMAEPLGAGAIVTLLLVIMLMSRESIRDRLIRLAGLQQIGLTTQMLNEAGTRVGNYLRAQLLVNTVYGGVVGVGLLLMGIPSALLCGLIAGVLRFVPIVGPWLGAAIPAALSLAVFDDWHHILIVLGLFAGLEILNNVVVEPWLYGSRTGLSSFGIVMAIVFWTWVWGAVGLVLAVPITACLIVFSRQVPRFGALAILLGDEPVLSESMRFYQRLLCGDEDEAAAILAAAPTDRDPAETLDAVVFSGLVAARADRHRGLITQAQAVQIATASREMGAEWLADVGAAASKPAGSLAGSRALCIPLGDELDETAARLLGELFQREGIESDLAPGPLLVAEKIALAAEPEVGVVVVCGVGPTGHAQIGRICKALARRVPDRPILAVVWGDPSASVGSNSSIPGMYALVNSSRAAARTALAILAAAPRDQGAEGPAVDAA